MVGEQKRNNLLSLKMTPFIGRIWNLSWATHRCQVYNQLCKVNTRFRDPYAGFSDSAPYLWRSGGKRQRTETHKNIWVFNWCRV